MDPIPARVGKFEILALIGRGAMGVVYKAKDPYIGRLVALKRISLSEAIPEDEKVEFKERFFIEARAAGGLRHPNIVTIHDVDEADGAPFMAMEFVEGGSLARLMKERGALPVDEAVGIVRQVALGLAFAHERGVVHRDIKPDNILIEKTGRVVITDFGAAHILTSELTKAGEVLGTPHYMSPEQVLGDPVDGRSDLFSLGVVLYLLLTGRRPFKGDTVSSVCYHIVHSPPEPLPEGRHLPPAAIPILEKLLAKDKAHRFQTGLEVAEALNTLEAARSPDALPPATVTQTWNAGTKEVTVKADAVNPQPASTVKTSGVKPAPSDARPAEPIPGKGSSRGLWIVLGLGGVFAVVLVLAVLGFIGFRIFKGRATPTESTTTSQTIPVAPSEPLRVSPPPADPPSAATSVVPLVHPAPPTPIPGTVQTRPSPAPTNPIAPKDPPRPNLLETPAASSEVARACETITREAEIARGLAVRRRFGKVFGAVDDLRKRVSGLKMAAVPGDESMIRKTSNEIDSLEHQVVGVLSQASGPILDQARARLSQAQPGRSAQEEAAVAAYAEAFPVIRWKDRLPESQRLEVEDFMRQCRSKVSDAGWSRAHALGQGRPFPGQS